MSGLLFFSKKQRYANRLLAALILVITLASFNLYGAHESWFGSPWLNFLSSLLPLVLIMLAGPLIYFYVKAHLDQSFKITKKQRRHFLVVIIDLVPSITVIIFIIGLLLHVFKNSNGPVWGSFIDKYNTYADIPRWASVSLYVWLATRYISTAKKQNAAGNGGQVVNYKWLQQLLRVFLVFQCIWFVFLIPYVIPKYSDKLLDAVDWYPIYIPMAIIVYWLGIKGYMVSQTVGDIKKTAAPVLLSPGTIKQVILLLESAMQQDKLYLNPSLNLDIVAQHTNLPPKTISLVLNQHMRKSFNEYINGYRIEAFKEKVVQPQMDSLTIAGIAYECGFNSQATFQRTFKQVTGISPSEFRKNMLQVH